MKQTIPIAALLVVAAVASPALAREFEYNYLEAGWVQSKINSSDNSTANGAGISGSAALGDYAHIFGDYAYQEFGHALHIHTYEAGGGFNRTVGDGLDLLGEASYVHGAADDEASGSTVGKNGWSVSVLLRYRLIEPLEVDGGVKYVDLSQAEASPSSM